MSIGVCITATIIRGRKRRLGTIQQLVGLGWDPMYVRKQGDGGGSDAVLLIRRRKGEPEAAEGAKLGCHLLYFHGNNQNLMGAAETLADFEREVGCEVWAVEYTGYGPMDGGPRGVPSEQALASDAMAAASWLSLMRAGRASFSVRALPRRGPAIEAAASIAARPTAKVTLGSPASSSRRHF